MGKQSLMCSLPDTDILCGHNHQGKDKTMGELLARLTIKEMWQFKVCSVYSDSFAHSTLCFLLHLQVELWNKKTWKGVESVKRSG